VGGSLIACAGLALAFAWIVLSTQWGVDRVTSRVRPLLPSGVRVGEIRGRLRSPLHLTGIEVETAATLLTVDRVRIEWSLWGLLAREFRVRDLEITTVGARMLPSEPDTSPPAPPGPLPEIQLPVRLTLARARVDGITVTPVDPESEPFTLDSLRVANLRFDDTLEVQRLRLDGPDVGVSLVGTLHPRGDYPLEAELAWRLRLPETAALEGRTHLSGSVERVDARTEVLAPVPADVTLQVHDLLDRRLLRADLDLPAAELQSVRAALPPARVAARVTAGGTQDSLDVSGSVDVDLPQTGPIRADLALTLQGRILRIHRLDAELSGRRSRLAAHGSVVLGEGTPQLDLDAEWKSLRWPLDGPTAFTSERGRLTVTGSAESYSMRVDGVARPANTPPVRLSLRGRGTKERLTIDALQGETLEGSVRATGTVAWRPALAWRLAVTGEGLDPSALVPDLSAWHGQVSFRARTDGRVLAGRTEGRLALDEVGGTLRNHALSGSASMDFVIPTEGAAPRPAPEIALDGFRLDWGPIRARAAGAVAVDVDVSFGLDVPDLGVAVPDGEGALTMEGRIWGPRSGLRAQATIGGSDLAVATARAGILRIDADVEASPGGVLRFEAFAAALELGERTLDSLALDIRGTPDRHHLTGHVVSPEAIVDLAADGGYADRSWTGSVLRLDVVIEALGDWSLEEPAAVSASAERADLQGSCFSSDPARFCLRGLWEAEGAADLEATLTGLPLDRFRETLPEGWRLTGTIDTELAGRVDPDGAVRASLRLSTEAVEVEYPFRDGTDTLRLAESILSATVGEDGVRGEVGLRLERADAAEFGRLDGRFAMPGYQNVHQAVLQENVEAHMEASFPDLSPFESLLPDMENLVGKIAVDVQVGGTPAELEIVGEARLAEGAADLPGLGLELREISLTARGTGTDWIEFDGALRSGSGTVRIRGESPVAPTTEAPVRIDIRGTRVLAMDTPEVTLWVSPELDVTATAERLDVTGQVRIPRARVELTEIAETAVQPSRDVVIVGDTAAVFRRGPNVHASVRISLGDSVSFRGFGFQAQPSGSLLAVDEPGRVTTGTGELVLTGGRYRAYGQDLTLERGRILFGGGPIDNPGLDLRAFRRASDGVVAGLEIGGTLRSPIVTIFSEPPMTQSEALAYIVLGHPLGQASASEGNRVANAATALGIKGGNLLARRIAERFGLEEVRIEAQGPLEEASLVAGKYLSPRLYVSYGIGLFDPVSTFRMRYILSSKWLLQAETGEGTGADLLYRIERGR
jgi:translocation and assembly module TamB